MKNIKKKKTLCLIAAAVVMVITLSIGSTMAYFSTYVVSRGAKPFEYKLTNTELDEKINAGTKTITIKNIGVKNESGEVEGGACFVRVKVIVAQEHAGKVSVAVGNDSKSGWVKKGDYYHYNRVLELGDVTKALNISINTENHTEDYNVVVIQESTPALYDKDGKAYADWDADELIITSTSGAVVRTPEEE